MHTIQEEGPDRSSPTKNLRPVILSALQTGKKTLEGVVKDRSYRAERSVPDPADLGHKASHVCPVSMKLSPDIL